MIDNFVKLEDNINNCLLSRLAKPYHEKEYHSEYQVRSNKLEQYFPKLIHLLDNVDFRQDLEIASSTLYSLLILYLELKTEGPWNFQYIKDKDYAVKLDQTFEIKYNITIEKLLQKNDFFNPQEVFDKCIKELHQKMTLDDFKKYPGLIEVYCLLIKNVKDYNITLNPVTVLPVALLLVDDYIMSNKAKGMQCCILILQCLKSDDFTTGNYYEVVYRSLKQNIYEKDIKVTQYMIKSLPDFLKILPPEVQKTKLDDVFSSAIDQLHTETNLYRKALFFNFVTKMIEMHGVHCKKKKMFKDIISDNLDICTNEGVYDILIQHILECLEMWIRHCWCIWKLHTGQKIISSLFKILYIAKEETILLQIQNLILTLINLCTIEEQKQIQTNLETVPKSVNVEFLTRINGIKANICT